jgi:hypothetical protein
MRLKWLNSMKSLIDKLDNNYTHYYTTFSLTINYYFVFLVLAC